jgi:3-hydroxyisobutyrate dehydrogenase-like beta-hydroxyacid dehydrogenase
VTTQFGVVGLGEAGSAIATSLAADGVSVMAYDIRLEGPDRANLARSMPEAVTLAPSAGSVAAACDVVLSVVPASAALAVATEVARHMRPETLVADLSSTSPKLARQIERVIEEAGGLFVDVAMMSAVPPRGHRVAMLVSGRGADRFLALPVAFDAEFVDTQAGSASAAKMLRSALVKGVEALLVEFAIAARRERVYDRILASIDESLPMTSWHDLAAYLVGRTARHATRRAHELRAAAETLRELGIEPLAVEGGARRLAWAAEQGIEERFALRPGATTEEILAWLDAAP